MTRRRGRRKPENAWLPPNVYKDRYGYRYYTPLTGENIRLAKLDASQAQVWARYDALKNPNPQVLDDVIEQYFQSPQFRGLAPTTQRDYQQYAKRIRAVFGSMAPETIQSPQVTLFMDTRGADFPTAANHEKAFLSLVFNWGTARGYIHAINPCDAVRGMKTKPGGRYIEEDEYDAFYQFLLGRKHFMHAIAMEIAYLCAARQQDVLRLYRDKPQVVRDEDCYVGERGLLIAQGKTGKRQLKQWSPRLRNAVELATSHLSNPAGKYLIQSKLGERFTRTGFNSTWDRDQRAAYTTGVIAERFRFHDLKITSISDYTGDKQRFSGHKTMSQAERYNRTPDEVKPVDG